MNFLKPTFRSQRVQNPGNLRSTLIGIAASAILLGVLGVARLLTLRIPVAELQIREIETLTIELPPPPLPPAEELLPDTPPPPPALTTIDSLPDPTRIPVPRAQVPMDITAPLESFFADLAPAPLPAAPKITAKSNRPRPEPVRKSTAKVKAKATTTGSAAARAPAPPAAKSQYNASELDATPRLLRHGSARFPASLARSGVSRGTVVFEVELSTAGSVQIRRVISSTHPELIPAARGVASGARFSPPRKNGLPVKAIMRWPIVIEK